MLFWIVVGVLLLVVEEDPKNARKNLVAKSKHHESVHDKRRLPTRTLGAGFAPDVETQPIQTGVERARSGHPRRDRAIRRETEPSEEGPRSGGAERERDSGGPRSREGPRSEEGLRSEKGPRPRGAETERGKKRGSGEREARTQASA